MPPLLTASTAAGRPARERDYDATFSLGKLRAYTKPDAAGVERKYIGGTASSTAKDLYGDIFAPSAQQQMVEKLRGLPVTIKDPDSGLTSWLNHSYKIPEDTLGAIVDAALVVRTGDDGEEYIDLDIEVRVTETNPRALAAWEQCQDGIRHGWSVGLIFLEVEWASEEPDDWSFLVTSVDLLEISLVGIPANQRAWCRSAEDLKTRAASFAAAVPKDVEPAQRRDLVTKSLVAAEATGETVTLRVRTSDFITDAAVRGILDEQLRSVSVRAGDKTYTLALAEEPREPVAGEAACAFKDGCEEKNAAGSLLCTKHAAEFPIAQRDGDDSMSADCMDAINLAIYAIGQAKAHGVCDAAGTHLDAAKKGLEDLLDPDDQGEEGEQLSAPIAKDGETRCSTGAEGENACILVPHAAEIQHRAAPKPKLTDTEAAEAAQRLAAANAEIEAKQAELATLATTIAERTTARDALEAAIKTATDEKVKLDKQLAELRSTPTGRRTVTGFASREAAAVPVGLQSHSLEDAQARLKRKLAERGSTDPNPPLRPE
ncbi:MAG: hypothetical protein JWN27_2902 [Candidatus Eremiobacteraeota bacterium]|nr:hypothetical protein [Candidatus Eremiobacteraeota bacterium]